ncbi:MULTISPECIES: sulfur globule protein precursor [unclassified Bradyrhizobium]|uniref:sulfur globule protein precursor n=1 Tax=unclassified Bradyrhizobium TaxID=2631580 RepID=UPI0028EA3D6D|nr:MULTISPECIES: sulfur globule protein precursor [unclassified Bradyrhizobium]
MLRKLSLIAAAAVALGAAALAPTAASAHWHGGWHGGGWHGGGWHGGWHRPFYGPRFFVGGPAYSYGYGGCYVRRVVPTPWGPRWRLINRCY